MRWSWFFLAAMIINYTLAFMFLALGAGAHFTASVAVALSCLALYRQELDYENAEDDA